MNCRNTTVSSPSSHVLNPLCMALSINSPVYQLLPFAAFESLDNIIRSDIYIKSIICLSLLY